MTPSGGGGGAGDLVNALYQSGPVGFLAAFVLFAYLCVREFRRYRETDVQTYKAQITELKEDIANLTKEVEQLRDSAFEGGVEASKQRAALATENARFRLLLARHGIDPDNPAFQVDPGR